MTLQVECHRCGYSWKYTGNSEYYASCPQCKTSVPLEEPDDTAEPADTADPVATDDVATAERQDVDALAERVEQLESTASELHTAIETMMSRVAELEELRAERSTAPNPAGGGGPRRSSPGNGAAPNDHHNPSPSPGSVSGEGAGEHGGSATASTTEARSSTESGESQHGGGVRADGSDTTSVGRTGAGSTVSGDSDAVQPKTDENGNYDYICPSCDGPISGKPDACIHCGTGFRW